MNHPRNTNSRFESGDPDSDVDASSATVTLIGGHIKRSISRVAALPSFPLRIPFSEHRRRRLAFGNSRLDLVVARKHVASKLARDWYAFSNGTRGRNKSYLQSDALNNTAALLHLVTRPDGTSYLHCLRAPMDYATPPSEPRLYGLGNSTPSDLGALHRFDSWTARTNYLSRETPRKCHEVEFVHDAASISLIPALRRFVTVEIIEPP